LAVGLEHRFFGKSQPTYDYSTDNLYYLSIDQALADFVTFQSFLNAQFNLTASNRWVSFGGSYSGALSAWLRQKYPDKFYAAYASSAPIALEQDFYEYLEVVAYAVKTTSPTCLRNLYSTVEQIKELVKTSAGRKTLSEKFK
jgi:pimeloyl-ACP methyl ester carboxylesterase